MNKLAVLISVFIVSIFLVGCAVEDISSPEEGGGVSEPKAEPEPIQKTMESKSVKSEPKLEPKAVPKEPEPAPEPEPAEDSNAKAEDIAKAYVKNMAGYKEQDGRYLKVTNAYGTGCEGCWIIDLRFERSLKYYPEKTEIIKVHVNMKDWKVDSYTFE